MEKYWENFVWLHIQYYPKRLHKKTYAWKPYYAVTEVGLCPVCGFELNSLGRLLLRSFIGEFDIPLGWNDE